MSYETIDLRTGKNVAIGDLRRSVRGHIYVIAYVQTMYVYVDGVVEAGELYNAHTGAMQYRR